MEMERGYLGIFSPEKIVSISFCSDFLIPAAYYNVAVLFDLCIGTYSTTPRNRLVIVTTQGNLLN